jgi:hypothetical protein
MPSLEDCCITAYEANDALRLALSPAASISLLATNGLRIAYVYPAPELRRRVSRGSQGVDAGAELCGDLGDWITAVGAIAI